MVAKFETGSSLSQTLNYNEKKVQSGVAQFLWAENYPMDGPFLTFDQKLNRLTNQAALNENVTRNSVHISLNFDPSEQYDKEKLISIANAYMEQIGFGEQPYLVYQHKDAGHPHIHIVSVKVRPDGKRVDTQNIGKNQSEKARKAIEIAFNLVKAEDSRLKEKYKLEPINAQKVQYGKMETKRAIYNVLKSVLETYKFSSLPELNALLKLYNVMADRGTEQSVMFHQNGLMYRVLDEQGNKVGAPVKASQFFMKPTMAKLEGLFKKNEPLKNMHRSRIKNAVDLFFLRNTRRSVSDLKQALDKEGIVLVLRQNETGRIYGVTYIDHKNKVIFNGSDLGKQYSANAIVDRCSEVTPGQIKANQQPGESRSTDNDAATNNSLLDALLQEEYTGDTIPLDLRKNKRKKRKRLNNNQ